MPDTTKPRRFRRILLGIVVVLLLAAGTMAGYVYLNYESIVRGRIERALPETLSIDFGSLVMDPLSGHAGLDDVTLLYGPPGHTTRYHSLKIERLEADGIGIFSLLARDRLVIDKIAITGGQLVIDDFLLKDTTSWDTGTQPTETGDGLRRVDIGTFQTDSLGFLFKGDSLNVCTLEMAFLIRHLGINLEETPVRPADIAYQIVTVSADSIRYAPEGGSYRYGVASLRYADQNLKLDSLAMKAVHPKYAFARHAGKQIDVFDLDIDSVRITRMPTPNPGDSLIEADRIVIHGPSLHVFRDRRMPFLKNHTEPLPMKRFQDLPFTVRVGGLEVSEATIVYEEFPEEGTESGSIVFDNMHARFDRLDNRDNRFNRFINLDVQARFMKSGLLKARFAFPLNPQNLYYAEGTLDDMELTRLNPTLENLAKIRIASGTMNSMHFNFDYSDDVSNGSVMLLYENLEMIALKDGKGVEEKHNLKSFLLNVLFARKNKKEEVRTAKRNGTINFERDKKRSVFNYWWKSLATGIKSGNSISEILDGGR